MIETMRIWTRTGLSSDVLKARVDKRYRLRHLFCATPEQRARFTERDDKGKKVYPSAVDLDILLACGIF